MNAKASALGMRNTHFVDPAGLDDADALPVAPEVQHTRLLLDKLVVVANARDTALMAQHLASVERNLHLPPATLPTAPTAPTDPSRMSR